MVLYVVLLPWVLFYSLILFGIVCGWWGFLVICRVWVFWVCSCFFFVLTVLDWVWAFSSDGGSDCVVLCRLPGIVWFWLCGFFGCSWVTRGEVSLVDV